VGVYAKVYSKPEIPDDVTQKITHDVGRRPRLNTGHYKIIKKIFQYEIFLFAYASKYIMLFIELRALQSSDP